MLLKIATCLNKFCQKLKNSGYGEKDRQEIIRAGILAHKKDLEAEKKGEKVMFRQRKEQRKDKIEKKKKGKSRRNKDGTIKEEEL